MLGTIVSKNFKDEISAHVQIIFDCAEKAFKVQKLSFKNEIIFELSKVISCLKNYKHITVGGTISPKVFFSKTFGECDKFFV